MEDPEGWIGHPFPPIRPNVEIAESEEPIGEVDCAELRWWFGIPRPGDRTTRASYDADTLELARVTDMEATGPARVHGIECVEVRVDEWSAESGRKNKSHVFYARVEEAEESRWLAVVSEEDGKRELFTFLDEGFESQWGASSNPARKLYDDGRYRLLPDGSYETTDGTGLGAGTYDVTIGGETFRCLRVLEPDLAEPGGGELTEAYVERGGAHGVPSALRRPVLQGRGPAAGVPGPPPHHDRRQRLRAVRLHRQGPRPDHGHVPRGASRAVAPDTATLPGASLAIRWSARDRAQRHRRGRREARPYFCRSGHRYA